MYSKNLSKKLHKTILRLKLIKTESLSTEINNRRVSKDPCNCEAQIYELEVQINLNRL